MEINTGRLNNATLSLGVLDLARAHFNASTDSRYGDVNVTGPNLMAAINKVKDRIKMGDTTVFGPTEDLKGLVHAMKKLETQDLTNPDKVAETIIRQPNRPVHPW